MSSPVLNKIGAQRRESHSALELPYQTALLAGRSLRLLARSPESIVPNMLISVFLLLIFNAALGGAAAFVPELQGASYLAFLLPFTLITAVLDSPAGQAVVRDIESGYFDKLLLTPVRRSALILGHIVASGLAVVLVAALLLAVALVMGLRPATGIGGLLVTLLFALLIGLGFSGFTVGVALRTGSAAATQGASFAFFPLAFLSTAFFPLDYLQGWLQQVARINPITYLLGALRTLLIAGWDGPTLAAGLLAGGVVGIVPFAFALLSLRVRTRVR